MFALLQLKRKIWNSCCGLRRDQRLPSGYWMKLLEESMCQSHLLMMRIGNIGELPWRPTGFLFRAEYVYRRVFLDAGEKRGLCYECNGHWKPGERLSSKLEGRNALKPWPGRIGRLPRRCLARMLVRPTRGNAGVHPEWACQKKRNLEHGSKSRIRQESAARLWAKDAHLWVLGGTVSCSPLL